MLSKSICEVIEGNFFYYLLTRFTTPEEVFGPLSLMALQRDDFNRKIDGYLPTAHIAFLDEIFKSNSSILNSFLTILNERKFHNGNRIVNVPLISVFGASNELPEENESLGALYDRFLFRCPVIYIEDEMNFMDLLFNHPDKFKSSIALSLHAIRDVNQRAKYVHVDDDVKKIILETRREFRSKNIHLSDRRWKKIVNVLKIATASIDHESVDRSMVLLLQHMAWDRPEQKEHIKNILMDMVISGGHSIGKLKKDAEDLMSLVMCSLDYRFPLRIRCYDCDEILSNSKELHAHKTIFPEHSYYDPYRTCLHLRFFNYKDLVRVLHEEYNWRFVENTPGLIRSYLRELVRMRERYKHARTMVEEETENLKRMLEANIWLSYSDKMAVMNRCKYKVDLLDDIDLTLCIIMSMIESNGQVGLMDRTSVFEAEAL
jgi:MoxR-like ATPase